MRSLLAGLVILTSTPALCRDIGLPLQDGVFTSRVCEGGQPGNIPSISVHTLADGSRFISPSAEGKIGSCTIGRVQGSGVTYSGSAPCTLGMKANLPDGTYKFAYKVENASVFTSRGVTYYWCAEHR